MGLVITTAYDSIPADSVNHIIKETEAKAIFTETSLFGTLNKAYAKLDKKDQLKFVFYAENIDPDVKPKPDDLALIMYTSGSTGPTKGVELTHANIIAATGAVVYLVLELIEGHERSDIVFLPFAHVLEFLVEFITISS